MNRVLTSLLTASLFLAPALAQAGAPAAGVVQEIHSGFFADVNLGGFFTAGGSNDLGSKGVSNAQPYLQLGIGYDIVKTAHPDDSFGLAIGITFGMGSSAASCFGSYIYAGTSSEACVADPSKGANDQTNVLGDNFTATMFGAEVVFKVHLADRLWLRPRIEGGYAMLDPAPLNDSDGNPINGGAFAGVGVGLEYATHMDHFSIGLDIGGRLIIGPNIPTFTFYPMIKYTF
jgi:hypothetical protein